MTSAVAARFTAFRSVPARAVMALTLDVASEDGEAAMTYLGWPAPGTSVHVAIVRLGETEPDRAVHGTYESCRTVAGRKALALTIDVPTERGHSVLKNLGVPGVGKEIEVGVVLLVGEPPPRTTKPIRDPGALAVQQAGIMANDPEVQRYLLGPQYLHGDAAGNLPLAENAMRAELGIVSRRELREDPEKLARWHAFRRKYENHQQGRAPDGDE